MSCRSIPFNVWVHVTVTYDSEKGIGKIFFGDSLEGRRVVDPAKTSLEIMNNSHSYYQIGSKKDSGETFHGLIRNIKVFNEVLTSGVISMEASGINNNGKVFLMLNYTI